MNWPIIRLVQRRTSRVSVIRRLEEDDIKIAAVEQAYRPEQMRTIQMATTALLPMGVPVSKDNDADGCPATLPKSHEAGPRERE